MSTVDTKLFLEEESQNIAVAKNSLTKFNILTELDLLPLLYEIYCNILSSFN